MNITELVAYDKERREFETTGAVVHKKKPVTT
jgi:hypothetical protein